MTAKQIQNRECKKTVHELYEKYYKNGNKKKVVYITHKNGKVNLISKRSLLLELKKYKAKYAFILSQSDLATYLKAYQDKDDKTISETMKKGKDLYLKYNKKRG